MTKPDDRAHHSAADLGALRKTIWNGVRKKDDWEGIVLGEPGSGKGSFSHMMGEELEPHPDADRHMKWEEYQHWRWDHMVDAGFHPRKLDAQLSPVPGPEGLYQDFQDWKEDRFVMPKEWWDVVERDVGRRFLVDLDKQALYTAKDVEDAGKVLPEFSVIINHEFLKAGGNRRRATTKANTDHQDDANMKRARAHVMFTCLGDYDDGDPRQLKWGDWAFELGWRGSGQAFEQMRVGGPKKKATWLQPRFPFRVPNPRRWNPHLDRAFERHDLEAKRGRRQVRDLLRRERFAEDVESVVRAR